MAEYGQSWASRFGSALGSGVGTGLQNLAQQRIDQFAQQKQQEQLAQQRNQYAQALTGLGIPQDQALALASLPEKERLAYFQRGGGAMQQQQQPQGNLSGLLGNLSGQTQGGVAQGINAISPNRQNIPAQQQMQPGQQQGGSSFLDVMGRPGPGEQGQERRHQENQALKEKLATEKRLDTTVLPLYREAQNKKDSGLRQNIILDEMKDLTINGDEQQLLANFTDAIQENYGINLSGLLNADTSEIRKLESYFLRDLKNVFGGRISNQEMENFMKGVPSLMMNKEGRLRVIDMMKLFNGADIQRAQNIEDILEKNPNITPFQFDKAVNKSMEKTYKDLEKDFKMIRQNSRLALENAEKFKVGSEHKTIPPVNEVPVGTKVKTPDGQVLKNNGTKWVKWVEGEDDVI